MQNTNFDAVSQEFIAAEVLKLYGLAKDTSQKTDWQKMLKFGRKKRDRVDHILVGHENVVCFIILPEGYILLGTIRMAILGQHVPNKYKEYPGHGICSVCPSGSRAP